MSEVLVLTQEQNLILDTLIKQADGDIKIAQFWGGPRTGKTFLLSQLEDFLNKKYKKTGDIPATKS